MFLDSALARTVKSREECDPRSAILDMGRWGGDMQNEILICLILVYLWDIYSKGPNSVIIVLNTS